MHDAKYWVDRLSLIEHPEGGYYRSTYKSDVILPPGALPPRFKSARPAATSTYFLLDAEDFSALHRLHSDELWHFYAGSALVVHIIESNGRYSEIVLGSEPESGEAFQGVVEAGCWFGASLKDRKSFALVGCDVAPGFDFADFELAKRADLIRLFPQHRALIEALTRS